MKIFSGVKVVDGRKFFSRKWYITPKHKTLGGHRDHRKPLWTQRRVNILKPAAFTASVCVAAYGYARYSDTAENEKQKRKNIRESQFRGLSRGTLNSEAKFIDLNDADNALKALKHEFCDRYPLSYKTCIQISLVNFAIFLAWKVQPFQKFLRMHFLHTPIQNRAHTLLTSTFSHQGFFHFFANTYVLMQFGPVFMDLCCKDSSISFLAFFVSTGTISSLAQHLFALTHLGRPTAFCGSLGSSGAIYGIIAGLTYLKPHLSLSIIFLPDLRLELWQGLLLMMFFDVVGIFRKNSGFSHLAHIGGALSGIACVKYMTAYPHPPRKPVSIRPVALFPRTRYGF